MQQTPDNVLTKIQYGLEAAHRPALVLVRLSASDAEEYRVAPFVTDFRAGQESRCMCTISRILRRPAMPGRR
jgi:hypothetical protein